MPVTLQLKTSGDHHYAKVIGDESDLRRVSRQTHEPLKAANGLSPEHVDVPEKKLGLIKVMIVTGCIVLIAGLATISYFVQAYACRF